VGGRKLISMSDLRDLFQALGFSGVTSLLQSGNLIFPSDRRTGAALERLLEVETKKRLDVSVDYFVRTAGEWENVVARNPFPEEAKRDPSHLVVLFLKEGPEAKNVKALQTAIRGPEIARADGKQLYIVYPAGIGDSKLTNAVIERTLGLRGTGRNWNTVLKLAALTHR
ncbi:MAG TPA: DUF1697 domain-containing protein, partial [Gemmataceae bacterium]